MMSGFYQECVDLNHTGLVQNTLASVDGFTGEVDIYLMSSANSNLGSKILGLRQ